MALTKGTIIVAPSLDVRTKSELDSLQVEAGLFQCQESVTILGFTSSSWSVTVLSNSNASNLKCYTQMWVPNTSTTPEHVFVRTSNGTTYSPFTELATKAYLEQNAVINHTGQKVEIKIQNTQPAKEAGKNIVWIDTSN